MLGGEELRKEAKKRATEEGREDLEGVFRSMAKRGKQANLSFFAFTATPKHKTFAVFGRDGRPSYRYTMRQAIEEGFILDVLKHYTTYGTYFKLLKACEDDPHVERKRAALALARFMKLHPHNIAQKTELMVEHFQTVTRHKIGGKAKAMVLTGSRLEAVRYKQSFDRYIQEKGYAIRSLVAFSGHRGGRQAGRCHLHRTGHETPVSLRKSSPRSSRRRSTRSCSLRRSTKPGSINHSCTRCLWTSGSTAFRPCRRYRG